MPTIERLPIVNFLEALKELRVNEWAEFGMEPPESTAGKLPDGRKDIYNRLWLYMANSHFGNQIFTNDTIFRLYFPSINGDPLSEDLQKLYNLCEEAVMDHILLFDVRW